MDDWRCPPNGVPLLCVRIFPMRRAISRSPFVGLGSPRGAWKCRRTNQTRCRLGNGAGSGDRQRPAACTPHSPWRASDQPWPCSSGVRSTAWVESLHGAGSTIKCFATPNPLSLDALTVLLGRPPPHAQLIAPQPFVQALGADDATGADVECFLGAKTGFGEEEGRAFPLARGGIMPVLHCNEYDARFPAREG